MNNALRQLDFEDLCILADLLEGESLTAIARHMHITQPAISQRLQKLNSVFETDILERAGRHVRLTTQGKAIATRAAAAIHIMQELKPAEQHTVINIGTRAEVGRSWLGPALLALRKSQPNITIHCHFGSGEEIIRLLGVGQLDAILTSAPITLHEYQAFELKEEPYVFLASSAIADSINRFTMLHHHTLIEHDRSFPFLRYLHPNDRAKLRFADVWFLGSTVLMLEAIIGGHGIGIVPEYLARSALESGLLQRIPLKVKLESDSFRLIYRRSRNIEPSMRQLAEHMRQSAII